MGTGKPTTPLLLLPSCFENKPLRTRREPATAPTWVIKLGNIENGENRKPKNREEKEKKNVKFSFSIAGWVYKGEQGAGGSSILGPL